MPAKPKPIAQPGAEQSKGGGDPLSSGVATAAAAGRFLLNFLDYGLNSDVGVGGRRSAVEVFI